MTVTAATAQGQAITKLNPVVTNENVLFDRAECIEVGKSLHSEYTTNEPFPHIVIDDFLPIDLLDRALQEFPKRQDGRFNDSTSKLKTGYQLEKIESRYITNLIAALNSAQFLLFLEEMTGIKGLIPDPHQAGGGLHETATGGHLSIHADFNIHPKLNLRRRMNLILFLNHDWKSSYGGELELWEKDMSACAKSVSPQIGRAVVFNTEDDSFHGHPEPLTCPEDVFRRSLALYYYTIPQPGELDQKRTTDFRARPGSADAFKASGGKNWARKWLPPVIYDALRGKG